MLSFPESPTTELTKCPEFTEKVGERDIYVTQPTLPPLDEFIPYLEKIWESKIITNGGPFHQELEDALCEHLGIEHISLFTNGTLALVTALQTLRVTGSVITTPYSFVATAHSLMWNGIQPIFIDVDPATFNMDPNKIEAAITPQTTAIVPVHCYGRPCETERIQEIADIYGLKVIYDAAHAFGVQDEGGSILRHGDLSILSFHATKVFNTFEGGAIISPDRKTKKRIDYLKNFGIADETTVIAPGINGKMCEVQAAMGLVQLKYIDENIKKRTNIHDIYRRGFANVKGIRIPPASPTKKSNYAYFVILVEKDYPITRDDLYFHLKKCHIHCRRYFYPLISDYPMYSAFPSARKENLFHASDLSDNVLCLPLYPDLREDDVERIISHIREGAND
ncbi:MAG: DegT/DnrJ/EryC1/StrS family aminotransferase [Gammaproteobacteria bacterium]|nr:DegT/DnrJ/EryC1/StrS family aminotransferase [Gammaproteobacteria bacterium]